MKIGAMLFSTDYAVRPDAFARAAEARGFESVWFPDHTHIPASRRTPFPPGGDLPEDYWHLHDPLLACTAAAIATERIALGTGVALVTERDPILLAKQVATLDQLSNGRLLFGIGAGWNAEEMENHGVAFDERWAVLEDRLAAMKTIWSQAAAEHHGPHVDFDPIWQWPKPVQQPHPPIWLGAATTPGRRRVARYCDGWLPIGFQLRDLRAELAELRRFAKEAGRDPDEIGVSIFWASEDLDVLREQADLGVERAIFGVPAVGEDEAKRALDRHAERIPKLA